MSLPNPNLDPDLNPMLSGQVESETEKTGSELQHWPGGIINVGGL
jgi:hypothetical protein